MVQMLLGLKNRSFVPHNVILVQGSPVPLLSSIWSPDLTLLISCLSAATASHLQRMWAEVTSSAPVLLHKGLLVSSIK